MTTGRPSFFRRAVPHAIVILMAGAASIATAIWAKDKIELITIDDISLSLSQGGFEWAEVTADGLSVTLHGTAPDEATRFAALSAAGRVVDASRIIDEMDVEAIAAIPPPKFSVEILNNEDGVTLIGLVPLESGPETIIDRVRGISDSEAVADLLESADFAPPVGWERALSFGLGTLRLLPRSKVSIEPGRVAVTAVAADPDDKRRIERRLRADAPKGVSLALSISAPRPVIAPFTLRFLIDEDGPRFDACAADTDVARRQIADAARATGMEGEIECTLGLGTPSTRWGEAAATGIRALGAIGEGSLTLSNADVTLIAAEGTPHDRFERETGELEGALPDVFSLTAILTPTAEEPTEEVSIAAEFTATRSPEGEVQLRGRLGDETTREAVESFAAAAFGSARIVPATRLDENVPPGWPNRVLAGLDALSELGQGVVTVTETDIRISGQTGSKNAQAEIARLLSDRLQSGASFEIDVTYSEALDPDAALPTPDECIDLINAAADARKITFAPSSSDIEPDAMPTVEAIADVLRDCHEVPIEIGGHTDSQGRESMNQQLSQARADAVLNAIMAQRVFTSNLTAVGYGEERPIADNDTEAGREANRRIEFRLQSEVAQEADAEREETASADSGADAETEEADE